MPSNFVSVSDEEIISINGEAVAKNTKMATKVGLIVFLKIKIFQTSYFKMA